MTHQITIETEEAGRPLTESEAKILNEAVEDRLEEFGILHVGVSTTIS